MFKGLYLSKDPCAASLDVCFKIEKGEMNRTLNSQRMDP
jgi:hypothetical protein